VSGIHAALALALILATWWLWTPILPPTGSDDVEGRAGADDATIRYERGGGPPKKSRSGRRKRKPPQPLQDPTTPKKEPVRIRTGTARNFFGALPDNIIADLERASSTRLVNPRCQRKQTTKGDGKDRRYARKLQYREIRMLSQLINTPENSKVTAIANEMAEQEKLMQMIREASARAMVEEAAAKELAGGGAASMLRHPSELLERGREAAHRLCVLGSWLAARRLARTLKAEAGDDDSSSEGEKGLVSTMTGWISARFNGVRSTLLAFRMRSAEQHTVKEEEEGGPDMAFAKELDQGHREVFKKAMESKAPTPESEAAAAAAATKWLFKRLNQQPQRAVGLRLTQTAMLHSPHGYVLTALSFAIKEAAPPLPDDRASKPKFLLKYDVRCYVGHDDPEVAARIEFYDDPERPHFTELLRDLGPNVPTVIALEQLPGGACATIGGRRVEYATVVSNDRRCGENVPDYSEKSKAYYGVAGESDGATPGEDESSSDGGAYKEPKVRAPKKSTPRKERGGGGGDGGPNENLKKEALVSTVAEWKKEMADFHANDTDERKKVRQQRTNAAKAVCNRLKWVASPDTALDVLNCTNSPKMADIYHELAINAGLRAAVQADRLTHPPEQLLKDTSKDTIEAILAVLEEEVGGPLTDRKNAELLPVKLTALLDVGRNSWERWRALPKKKSLLDGRFGTLKLSHGDAGRAGNPLLELESFAWRGKPLVRINAVTGESELPPNADEYVEQVQDRLGVKLSEEDEEYVRRVHVELLELKTLADVDDVDDVKRNSIPFAWPANGREELAEFEAAMKSALVIMTAHHRLIMGSRAAESGLALLHSSVYHGTPWTSSQFISRGNLDGCEGSPTNVTNSSSKDDAAELLKEIEKRQAKGTKSTEMGFDDDDEMALFCVQLRQFMFGHADVMDDKDEMAMTLSRARPGEPGETPLERNDGALGIVGRCKAAGGALCRSAAAYCRAVQDATHVVNWVKPVWNAATRIADPMLAIFCAQQVRESFKCVVPSPHAFTYLPDMPFLACMQIHCPSSAAARDTFIVYPTREVRKPLKCLHDALPLLCECKSHDLFMAILEPLTVSKHVQEHRLRRKGLLKPSTTKTSGEGRFDPRHDLMNLKVWYPKRLGNDAKLVADVTDVNEKIATILAARLVEYTPLPTLRSVARLFAKSYPTKFSYETFCTELKQHYEKERGYDDQPDLDIVHNQRICHPLVHMDTKISNIYEGAEAIAKQNPTREERMWRTLAYAYTAYTTSSRSYPHIDVDVFGDPRNGLKEMVNHARYLHQCVNSKEVHTCHGRHQPGLYYVSRGPEENKNGKGRSLGGAIGPAAAMYDPLSMETAKLDGSYLSLYHALDAGKKELAKCRTAAQLFGHLGQKQSKRADAEPVVEYPGGAELSAKRTLTCLEPTGLFTGALTAYMGAKKGALHAPRAVAYQLNISMDRWDDKKVIAKMIEILSRRDQYTGKLPLQKAVEQLAASLKCFGPELAPHIGWLAATQITGGMAETMLCDGIYRGWRTVFLWMPTPHLNAWNDTVSAGPSDLRVYPLWAPDGVAPELYNAGGYLLAAYVNPESTAIESYRLPATSQPPTVQEAPMASDPGTSSTGRTMLAETLRKAKRVLSFKDGAGDGDKPPSKKKTSTASAAKSSDRLEGQPVAPSGASRKRPASTRSSDDKIIATVSTSKKSATATNAAAKASLTARMQAATSPAGRHLNALWKRNSCHVDAVLDFMFACARAVAALASDTTNASPESVFPTKPKYTLRTQELGHITVDLGAKVADWWAARVAAAEGAANVRHLREALADCRDEVRRELRMHLNVAGGQRDGNLSMSREQAMASADKGMGQIGNPLANLMAMLEQTPAALGAFLQVYQRLTCGQCKTQWCDHPAQRRPWTQGRPRMVVSSADLSDTGMTLEGAINEKLQSTTILMPPKACRGCKSAVPVEGERVARVHGQVSECRNEVWQSSTEAPPLVMIELDESMNINPLQGEMSLQLPLVDETRMAVQYELSAAIWYKPAGVGHYVCDARDPDDGIWRRFDGMGGDFAQECASPADVDSPGDRSRPVLACYVRTSGAEHRSASRRGAA